MTYKSECRNCGCGGEWHNQKGTCEYNALINGRYDREDYGRCSGCNRYAPTDNLELLEWHYEKTL